MWHAAWYGSRLNAWFMPRCSVEPCLDGKVSFTFGEPDGKPFFGSVTEWDAHVAVEYTFDVGARLRFELTPVPGGAHVVLVFAFAEGTEADPIEGDPGGDVPGGPGTPWQPGFLAGLHLCAEALGPHLAGNGLSPTEAVAAVNAFNSGLRPAEWYHLLPRYRDLIVHTLPPA